MFLGTNAFALTQLNNSESRVLFFSLSPMVKHNPRVKATSAVTSEDGQNLFAKILVTLPKGNKTGYENEIECTQTVVIKTGKATYSCLVLE